MIVYMILRIEIYEIKVLILLTNMYIFHIIKNFNNNQTDESTKYVHQELTFLNHENHFICLTVVKFLKRIIAS